MSVQNFYPMITLRDREFGLIEAVSEADDPDAKVMVKTVTGDLYFCFDADNPRFLFPFGRAEGEEDVRVVIPKLPGELSEISSKWNEFLDLLGVPKKGERR